MQYVLKKDYEKKYKTLTILPIGGHYSKVKKCKGILKLLYNNRDVIFNLRGCQETNQRSLTFSILAADFPPHVCLTDA